MEVATNTNQKVCLRCGHRWLSLLARPVVCPRCKSYRHDTPRKPRTPKQNGKGPGT